MIKHQKRSSGISLLEMLLVFLIASIIALLGFEHYLTLHTDQDLIALRKNVDLLVNYANIYYRKHPHDTMKQYYPCTNCEAKMKADGVWPNHWPHGKLLPNRLVQSNDDLSYDVDINDFSVSGCVNCYQIVAKIRLKDSLQNLDWFQKILDATTRDNFWLYWKRLPSYSIPSMETNLWIFNAGLEQFKKTEDTMQVK